MARGDRPIARVAGRGTSGRAVRIDPADADAHYRRARTLLDVGDTHGARSAYSAALLAAPGFAAAHRDLAALLIDEGRADRAIAICRRGLAFAGDDPSLRALLADALLRSGDAEGSDRAYDRSLRAAAGENELAARLLAALSDVPNVRLFRLPSSGLLPERSSGSWSSVADAASASPAVDLGPWLLDFEDVVAALGELDAIVTVDGTVAHLAGALGRPAWVVAPTTTHWRWLARHGGTPWYPSMRLSGRTRRANAVGELVGEIARFARERAGV